MFGPTAPLRRLQVVEQSETLQRVCALHTGTGEEQVRSETTGAGWSRSSTDPMTEAHLSK